ncbi:MAG: VOC family protein [Candidatus Gracilibacteria bacterium]
MSKVTGIDHIAVYVSHMAEGKKFFIEGLGLEEKGDYGDEYFMSAGTQVFALFSGDNTTQTINHIALNVDDIEGIKLRLENMGYKIYKGDMVDGPDGIRIQLVA